MNYQANHFEFGVDRHQIAVPVFGLGFLLSTGQPGSLRGGPHERKPARRPIWTWRVWALRAAKWGTHENHAFGHQSRHRLHRRSHRAPAQASGKTVRAQIAERGRELIIDHCVSHTGDDIAIVMTHRQGVGHPSVHKLAWDAFVAGTGIAREQGLYGAGQDLLKDAFSGNVKGMGPAVAEMEFDERPNEPFLFFGTDKTDPGAFHRMRV